MIFDSYRSLLEVIVFDLLGLRPAHVEREGEKSDGDPAVEHRKAR